MAETSNMEAGRNMEVKCYQVCFGSQAGAGMVTRTAESDRRSACLAGDRDSRPGCSPEWSAGPRPGYHPAVPAWLRSATPSSGRHAAAAGNGCHGLGVIVTAPGAARRNRPAGGRPARPSVPPARCGLTRQLHASAVNHFKAHCLNESGPGPVATLAGRPGEPTP